jgi:hypothetical protein
VASQPATQQNESTLQRRCTHGSQVFARGRPTWQRAWAHLDAPQSAEQVPDVSLLSQRPLPQVLAQDPQSAAQVPQLSPRNASHRASPQNVGHGPQSSPHVAQDSDPPQTPSPHPARHTPQSVVQLAHVSPAQK